MYVRLKTLERMRQEYGVDDYDGNPDVEAGWTDEMTEALPEDRVVEVVQDVDACCRWHTGDDIDDWHTVSEDMIEEWLGDRLLAMEALRCT